MKILLICGCIEPGKDGVGDYSRQLAVLLQNEGIECFILSLNDSYVNKPVEVYEEGVKAYRLPASLDKNEKTVLSRKYIMVTAPDLISIQFVSYSFHSKGVIAGWTSIFKKIVKGFRVHLMFHELWLGAHINANVKEKIVGKIQKTFILRFIKAVAPVGVSTNTLLFQFLLKQHNIQSNCLPVFGNIPVKIDPEFGWIYNVLSRKSILIASEERSDYLMILFFGSLDPAWDYAEVVEKLEKIQSETEKKIIIMSVGKMGYSEGIWNELNSNFSHTFYFYQFGEQEVERVSELLSFADVGLTTYPDILIEKSGTVAAMLEHQLPVVVSNFNIKVKGFESTSLNNNSLLVDIRQMKVTDVLTNIKGKGTVPLESPGKFVKEFYKAIVHGAH